MNSLAFSDLNECTETPDACLNGRCENTDGSYRCICIDGFTLSPDRRVCQGKCFMNVFSYVQKLIKTSIFKTNY